MQIQQLPSLDIVIPCYNAEKTIERAIISCLAQETAGRIVVVDDASTDESWDCIQAYVKDYPERIQALSLPDNAGVSMARNWGAMHSSAELVAFLDADDAYEASALNPVPMAFSSLPELSLIRLRLNPIDLAPIFSNHADFSQAWDIVQMTVGGNMVLRRSVLLACGGFPTHGLFRRLGGEDGALGIALAETTCVGTLFEPHHAGVQHFCRPGMHAERLLRAQLFNEKPENVSAQDIAEARSVTDVIKQRLGDTRIVLEGARCGRTPLILTYSGAT